MYLKQVLFAKFDENSTFTVYKYKNNYLIRKLRKGDSYWSEYDSFALVLESLKAFEYNCRPTFDNTDDSLPF